MLPIKMPQPPERLSLAGRAGPIDHRRDGEAARGHKGALVAVHAGQLSSLRRKAKPEKDDAQSDRLRFRPFSPV